MTGRGWVERWEILSSETTRTVIVWRLLIADESWVWERRPLNVRKLPCWSRILVMLKACGAKKKENRHVKKEKKRKGREEDRKSVV